MVENSKKIKLFIMEQTPQKQKNRNEKCAIAYTRIEIIYGIFHHTSVVFSLFSIVVPSLICLVFGFSVMLQLVIGLWLGVLQCPVSSTAVDCTHEPLECDMKIEYEAK